MILTEEQEVLDLVGQAQRVGNNSTAKTNLRHATTQIENHLGTSLVRTERVDYFGCPTNIKGPLETPAYILNLTQGFLDAAQPFEVFYSSDGEPILDIADANAELQTADAYDVNYDLGRVTLYGTTEIPTIPFRSIAIHYTAGFEVDDHEIAQNTPLALRSSAASLAANNMRVHSPNQTNKQPYRWMQDNLRRVNTGLLSAYIRPRVSGDEPQVRGTV